MLLVLAALALCGFLVKTTDDLIDIAKRPRLAWLPGIAYGLLGAYAVAELPMLAPVGVGIMLGVVLTRKVDDFAHTLGVVAFAIPLVANATVIEPVLLAMFALAAVLDEIGNDLADKKKLHGIARQFFSRRLSAEAIAFTATLYTGNIEFFAAVLVFDAGYMIAEKISGKAIVASL